jgi:hypothetical protein
MLCKLEPSHDSRLPSSQSHVAWLSSQMWRMDKYLRRLDVSAVPVPWARTPSQRHMQHSATGKIAALVCCRLTRHCCLAAQAALVVADGNMSLQITGNGDVLEPHDGIIGEQWAGRPWVACLWLVRSLAQHALLHSS